jgi:TPR repeat protein
VTDQMPETEPMTHHRYAFLKPLVAALAIPLLACAPPAGADSRAVEEGGGTVLTQARASGDPAEFVATLEAAALAGNVDAQIVLGLLGSDDLARLRMGRRVDSEDWLRRAAEGGSACAMTLLGNFYLHGEAGVPYDPVEAADWLRRSAQRGGYEAKIELVKLYREGAWMPIDPAEFNTWIRDTAVFGVVSSLPLAADLALAGDAGVAQDPIEAYQWISLATQADPHNTELALQRERIGQRLSARELEEAQARIAAFKPLGVEHAECRATFKRLGLD